MTTKNWKELEGKPWRLDVGSTQKEALSATNPAILHVTTEQSIVMNGEVVGRGKPDISAEGARAAIALYAAAGDKKLFGPNNILNTNNNTLGGTIGKGIYDSSTPTEYKKGSPFEVFCTQGIMSGVHSEKYMIWFGLRKSATNIERYSCQQVIGQTEEEFYEYGAPVAFRLNDGKVYTPFKGSSGLSIGTSKEYILSRECVIPSYSDLHDAATSEKDGLMSAADKQKLDNVPTNTKAKLKKLSNPDFKVVVRKAIPLHPRKGMKYFFDNDIRFSIPRKYIVDEGNTITVPNDGKTYYTIPCANYGCAA